MNVHVPKEIQEKYPNFEFRGQRKIYKDREVIKAYNDATELSYYYSFEEDFFWHIDTMPDWKLPPVKK